MANIPLRKGDRFIVCTGCSGGRDLAKALQGRVPVETTDCMNVCDSPVSLAVRAEGKAAYLFTGVDPDAPEDIEAFARLYAEHAGLAPLLQWAVIVLFVYSIWATFAPEEEAQSAEAPAQEQADAVTSEAPAQQDAAPLPQEGAAEVPVEQESP